MWALSCLLPYNVWPAVGFETAKLGVRGFVNSTAEPLASSSGCPKSVSGSQAIAMSVYRQRTWDQSKLSRLLSFSIRVQLIIIRFIFNLSQLLSCKDSHEVCLKHVHHHDIRHRALKNASLHSSTQRHGLQQMWHDEAWV